MGHRTIKIKYRHNWEFYMHFDENDICHYAGWKNNDIWRIPLDHVISSKTRKTLETHCLGKTYDKIMAELGYIRGLWVRADNFITDVYKTLDNFYINKLVQIETGEEKYLQEPTIDQDALLSLLGGAA